MKVRDVMIPNVPVVSPETSLSEAAVLLKEMETPFLPVQEEERLSGLIGAEDIVSGALAEGVDPDTVTVRDVMENATVFCGADEDAAKALETMKQTGATQLVVLDENCGVAGILPLEKVLPLIISPAEEISGEEPLQGAA